MRVYIITNAVNGKQYVGQTVRCLASRWKRHCWASTAKNRTPIALAISKYGRTSFTIREIETCRTQRELNKREIHWARELNTFSPNGYNLKAGAGPGAMSDETKAKIRKAHLGRKATPLARKHMSAAHRGHRLATTSIAKLQKHYAGRQVAYPTYHSVCVYKLVNPSGEVVKIVNMRRFCAVNGLGVPKMNELAHGKRDQYRGWTRP